MASPTPEVDTLPQPVDRSKLVDGRAHPRLGINAERGCTDCWMLFFFILVWGGMGYVANIAFANGEPQRLVRGTDYRADTCGVGDNANKKLLWYPIGFNQKSGDFVIKDALKMGLCVESCPQRGQFVSVYGPAEERKLMPSRWFVLFDSYPKYHRCFPNFGTFDCNRGGGNTTQCRSALESANGTWASVNNFNSVMEAGFNEVAEAWWIILAAIGITIVLSFLWLFILRRLVKPVVVLTVFLLLAGLIGLGALFWTVKGKKEALDPPQTESAEHYQYAAIAAWVVAFIYLCVLMFIWRSLMTACDIIEEATKVPLSIPTMVLVPPVALLVTVPFMAFGLVVAVYVQSSGDKITVTLPFSDLVNSTAATAAGFGANMTSFSNVTDALTKEYEFSNWRIYAHLYNLFVFLWTFGFVGAIAFMVLALCAVYWYWSNPGDNKTPPNGAVCTATCTVTRYHLGTVALGSFIVALIQLARVLLAIIEQRMRELGEQTEATKFLFKVLHCCLAYLECVVRFINKNGYIMCAMEGTSFLASARKALSLLGGNVMSVTAVTVISEYVMMFGKVVVTVVTLIITYFIIQGSESDDGISGGWVVLLIVMIFAFLISCLFANVFSVCIDTVLLCYCYDLQEDGDDYYPLDLRKHVDAATLAKGDKQRAVQEQELQQKLNPEPRREDPSLDVL